MSLKSEKQKIVVIGGGVGAITAAYALTTLPDWSENYEITIYQLGWRLGGKGASGRNMAEGGRIEEHGLHIWAGFYENAFRLMRDCYETMNATGIRAPEAPLGTLDKAFKPLNHFLLAEDVQTPKGKEWRPWLIEFMGNSDVPGKGGVLPSPYAYFQMFLDFLEKILDQMLEVAPQKVLTEAIPAHVDTHLRARGVSAQRTPLHTMRTLIKELPGNPHRHSSADRSVLAILIAAFQDWLQGPNFDQTILNDDTRRLYYMMDLGSAFARGMLHSNVLTDGFDPLDRWECSAWLRMYGASDMAINSAIFRGCYDYVFGYPGGMTDNREVGAGTALRGLLRLAFTYKGGLFYKMQAGMGDTIFGPYYQVLKSHGVKFKYFHAVTALRLNADNSAIGSIEMVQQAKVKSGAYDPFVEVCGLPCWPSEPLWDQLVDGAKLKASGIDFESEKSVPVGTPMHLTQGRDFDAVILGASLGSLGYMCQDLISASDRWQNMMDNVKTVATQAVQMWLDEPAENLGWPELVAGHNDDVVTPLKTVMTGFAEPMDTWADMSDLLMREDWAKPAPKSIAYFCSPSHDADFPQPPLKQRTIDWIEADLLKIWPKAQRKDGGFNYDLLHDPEGRKGVVRLDAQYFRSNYYGSERYVLSVPNSVQYRLPPDDTGFANLVVAGDWTRCGINAGCVEAASISGLVAAEGISGADFGIVGAGDLLPDAEPQEKMKLASPYAQSARWPLTPFYSVGQMDGWFSFHALPDEQVAAMLPKGLSLAPQTITKRGTHPVTLLCNRQIGVRASFLPEFLGFAPYHESILAINCVTVDGQPGMFSTLPVLYLDHYAPTIAGRVFYNFNKEQRVISVNDSAYNVTEKSGGLVWSGKYAQPDTARPLSTFAGFNQIYSLLEQPVITAGRLTKWHFSAFNFGLASGYAAPVHARISIGADNGLGLPTGEWSALPLGDEAGHLPGAFRFWTRWTLTNPLDSKRIATLAGAQELYGVTI